MQTILAGIAAMAMFGQPTQWFGPATATFNISFPGNPYDAVENDVRVRFVGDSTEERLAYYDEGKWKAVLVAKKPGTYKAVLVRNGQDTEETASVFIDSGTKLKDGFVRVDETRKRFELDSGKVFFPLGHNLGWQSGTPDLVDQLKQMGDNGANWARIWACSWDGKNPYWPSEAVKLAEGQMWPKALARWDQLVQAAEKNDIKFQFVLFHHGLFTSVVNPNWPQHPWNTANGGFLKTATEFFTDPKAKRLTKNWLRYAVARWGHSGSVMAWELFNEVEWVDARYANKWGTITAWHKEMADYLRSIDPYKHLITTSSDMEQTELWAAMDYYQPHTYPPNVFAAVSGTKVRPDKPIFFGEAGLGTWDGKPERNVVRDCIWGGIIGCHAGTAQYWSWDRLRAKDSYDDFKMARQILNESDYLGRKGVVPVKVGVESSTGGDLSFAPGIGWGKTTRFRFRLPEDARAETMGMLSSFLQSQVGGNKGLCPNPIVFEFTAKAPGTFDIALATIAKAGGQLKVTVNGVVAFDKTYPAGGEDQPANEVVKAPFKAGRVEVVLENKGTDWVVIKRFSVPGIAPRATCATAGNSDFLIGRLSAIPDGAKPVDFKLNSTGLRDGDYLVTIHDLDTGKKTESRAAIIGGKTNQSLSTTSKEAVVTFVRKV